MFLIKMKYWFTNFFSKDTYSDFAYLGDLSNYSLEEMRTRLKSTWFEETLVYDEYQMVTWTNRQSSYSLVYTLTGEFIQIKEEKWLNEQLAFINEVNLGKCLVKSGN